MCLPGLVVRALEWYSKDPGLCPVGYMFFTFKKLPPIGGRPCQWLRRSRTYASSSNNNLKSDKIYRFCALHEKKQNCP